MIIKIYNCPICGKLQRIPDSCRPCADTAAWEENRIRELLAEVDYFGNPPLGSDEKRP